MTAKKTDSEKKLSPFDFVNDISFKKKSILNESNRKEYLPFVVNRALGAYRDTIQYAQEMNQRWSLPIELQYRYLMLTVPTRKRFSPWMKSKKDEKLEIIQEYYNYNVSKAREVYDLVSDEMLEKMKARLDVGGNSKK